MTTAAFAATASGLGTKLGALPADLIAFVQRYVRYRRTYAELDALTIDGLLDLDLYRGDLKRVAWEAAASN